MYDGKVVFEVELNTKNYDTQMEKTKKDLKILTAKYDELNKNKKNDYIKEQLLELGMEIEKTSNKYVDLKRKQDAVFQADYKKSLASVKNIGMMSNSMYGGGYSLQYRGLSGTVTQLKGDLPYVADKIKDVSANVRNAGNNSIKAGQQVETSGHLFDKGFSRGLKSVKKLAMGIIGIRSAYFLARRAASSYMSEDTELTEKMNKAWFNLGAFLEPFLTFVADAMLKITGYLNEFIKALTGTDYLARANAKALAKQTKEQEKLNSAMDKYQQYDFDVIRTQSSTGAGGVGGTGESGLSALGDVELNQGLVKGIQNLAGAIKNLIDLITFKDIREGIEELDEASRIEQDVTNNLVEVATNTAKIIKETPNVPKADLDTSKLFLQQNKDYLRLIEDAQNSYDKLKSNFPILTSFGVIGERELNVQKNYRKSLQANIKALIEMAKQGRLTEDGYIALFEMVTLYSDELEKTAEIEGKNKFALQDVYDALSDYTRLYPNTISQILGFGKATKTQKEQVADLTDKFMNGKITIFDYVAQLSKIPKNVSTTFKVDDKDAETKTTNYKNNILNIPTTIWTTIKATLDTTEADRKANEFLNKINVLGIGTSVMQSFRKIMGFAGGGYISQPTLAMVGEGKYNEYVIPEGEDYISRLANEIGKYGSGGGTTNVYLDGRLIQREMSKTANKVSFTRNGR